jgi:hypothetical protein
VRRYSVTPSSRLGIAVLIAGAALVGCTSKERPRDTSRAGSTTGAAPAPVNTLATQPPSTANLPGALTKPIDQYTGDEFFDFVQRLRWGGGVERDRKCKGNAGCDGTNPSRHTLVRVDAVDGQDSISATTVPTNGVIAVRAINRGNLAEDRYGFKPQRNLEYYMIVLPGTGGNGSWRFEELDTTPGARRHTSVGTGTFKPCNHPYRPGRVNRANFFTCANSPNGTDSVQKSNLMMFDPLTDPIWIDCAAGCCIVD